MHSQLHGSILIISHQERILDIADEILLIADGELREKGTKEEMMPKALGTANAAAMGCKKLTGRNRRSSMDTIQKDLLETNCTAPNSGRSI